MTRGAVCACLPLVGAGTESKRQHRHAAYAEAQEVPQGGDNALGFSSLREEPCAWKVWDLQCEANAADLRADDLKDFSWCVEQFLKLQVDLLAVQNRLPRHSKGTVRELPVLR